MDGNLFSTVNKTKVKIPPLPIFELKNEILGKKYSLSLAYVDEKTSGSINKQYRGKDKPTNILSFPLSNRDGEILICPSVVKHEAKDKEKNRGKNFTEYLGFLVIHGMLHLKGMQHSSRMERAEDKYDKKYFGGNRHRHDDGKSRSGRISKRRKNS